MNTRFAAACLALAAMCPMTLTAGSANTDPAAVIAQLDTQYQAAVERGDWVAMDRILHRDFTLVLGKGTVYSRAELLESARRRHVVFDEQVEVPGTQKVRMFGDHTATVTALLIVKGQRSDSPTPFDYKVWFTDTYVLTDDGWRYAFGQASLPLTGE